MSHVQQSFFILQPYFSLFISIRIRVSLYRLLMLLLYTLKREHIQIESTYVKRNRF